MSRLSDTPPPSTRRSYGVIASRDTVVFPHTATALTISRPEFVELVQSSTRRQDPLIVIVAQKHPAEDVPSFKTLYDVGTLCSIVQVEHINERTLKVFVEGLSRVAIEPCSAVEGEEGEYLSCYIDIMKTEAEDLELVDAHMSILKEKVDEYVKISKIKSLEHTLLLREMDQNDPETTAYKVASHLTEVSLKQSVLSENFVSRRLEKLSIYLSNRARTMEVKQRIQQTMEEKLQTHHRDYLMRLKADAVRQELGEQDSHVDLEEALEKATHLPLEARQKLQSELRKLRTLSNASPEIASIRSYIEFGLCLPWNRLSTPCKNLVKAAKILKKSHTGLDKVIERIIEFLAVKKRRSTQKGTILCLVGPPGVGKTSIAKSIAKAMNLDFASIALGGCGDEAEIRGHRRTYVGAMPGRILKALKARQFAHPEQGPTSNSVILLDETDKMGNDRRGDPAAALLEVLDPEQNVTFTDNYLEIPYDLSHIFFIATANDASSIPEALRDRMELIYLSGYTVNEKIDIARNHLIEKQREESGLSGNEFTITPEALYDLITQYCPPEAGVRGLSRKLAALARKSVVEIDVQKKGSVHITAENLQKYLGVPLHKFFQKNVLNVAGVVNGLAWTKAGGDMLPIEVLMVPGKGKIQFTGKLGEVMQESVRAAFSYVKSLASRYGIKPDLFEQNDFHVHFPGGAVPKDGPSAGMGICLAFLSQILKKPIPSNYGCTGEISLVGTVWPIGGLREKLLAALMYHLDTIFIPAENEKDLEDIPDHIKTPLTICLVRHVDEVVEKLFSLGLESQGEPKLLLTESIEGKKTRKKKVMTKDSSGSAL